MRWKVISFAFVLFLLQVCFVPSAFASEWDMTQNWDSGYSDNSLLSSSASPWHSSSSWSSSYGGYTDTYSYSSASYSFHLGVTSSTSTSYYYDTAYLYYDFNNPFPSKGLCSFRFYARYAATYFGTSPDGSTWSEETIISSYSGSYGWYSGYATIPAGTKYIRWRAYGYYMRYYYYYGLFLDDIQTTLTSDYTFYQGWDSGYSDNVYLSNSGSPWHATSTYSSTQGGYTDTYSYNSYNYSLHLGRTSSSNTYSYQNYYLYYDFETPLPVNGYLDFYHYTRYTTLYLGTSTNGTTWSESLIINNSSTSGSWTESKDNLIPAGTKYIRWRAYGERFTYYYYYGAFIDTIFFDIPILDLSISGDYDPDKENTGIINFEAEVSCILPDAELSVEWEYFSYEDGEWVLFLEDDDESDGFTAQLDTTGKSSYSFMVRAMAIADGLESDYRSVSFTVMDQNITLTPPDPNGGEMSMSFSISAGEFYTMYPPNPWEFVGGTYSSSSTYYFINSESTCPFGGSITGAMSYFRDGLSSSYYYKLAMFTQNAASNSFTSVAMSSSIYFSSGTKYNALSDAALQNLPSGLLLGTYTNYRGYFMGSSSTRAPYVGNPQYIFYGTSLTAMYSHGYSAIPVNAIWKTTGYPVNPVCVYYKIGIDGEEKAIPISSIFGGNGSYHFNWESWAIDTDDLYFIIRYGYNGKLLEDGERIFGPFSVHNTTNLELEMQAHPDEFAQLNIDVSATEVQFRVNSSMQSSPFSVTTQFFKTFMVEAPATVIDVDGVAWSFDGWSDGGSRAHEVVIDPDSSADLKAYYRTQAYFGVVSSRMDYLAAANGYYDIGTEMQVQVSEYSYVDEYTRYRYTGYSVPDYAISGTETWKSFELSSRTVIYLYWQLEYYFSVENANGLGSGTADGWYDDGATVSYTLPSYYESGTGARMSARGFAIDGTTVSTTTYYSTTLTEPLEFTCLWTQMYLVSVNTNIGTVSMQSGWFDVGTELPISTESPENDETSRFVFNNWTGEGSGSVTSTEQTITITVNSPITQAASWRSEYYLELSAANGTFAQGASGWYESGTEITLEIAPPSVATGSRYIPMWTGEGINSLTTVVGEDVQTVHTFCITEPMKQSAIWHLQHMLTISNAEGIGTVTPGVGSYWYFDGDVVSGLCEFIVGDRVCAGFTGTGSVAPATTPYFTFAITGVSTVSWTWRDKEDAEDQDWETSEGVLSISSPYLYDSVTDSNGNVVIAYLDGSSIKISRKVGTSWVTQTIYSAATSIDWLDINVDALNKAYVVFYDKSNSTLVYVPESVDTKADAALKDNITMFDLDGDAGINPHIAVNANGDIFVSFYDLGQNALKIAILKSGSTSWDVELVDDYGNAGFYNAIDIHDPDGQPAIAYYCAFGRSLKYAVRTTEGWDISVVDDQGSQGFYPSLSHSPDGVPFISYQDVSDTNAYHLKFATTVYGDWFTTTVDNTNGVGYNSSIFYDENGYIHIVHHNESQVFYARFNGSSWETSVLGGTNVSGNTSISVGDDLFPEVIYLDGGEISTKAAKVATTDDPGTGEDPNNGGDDTSDGGGGGCFVATAAFGSLAADSVATLTGVRDCSLAASTMTEGLVKLYYVVSPSVATSISDGDAMRAMLRRFLAR